MVLSMKDLAGAEIVVNISAKHVVKNRHNVRVELLQGNHKEWYLLVYPAEVAEVTEDEKK